MQDISLTNESFDMLKGSSSFLNLVINNITSCVLLLNQKMELQAFNDATKTIFSNKLNEHLLYKRCGEAIGCAYQIEEAKNCGETSRCTSCELRISAMKSYMEDKDVYKTYIERPFYKRSGEKVMKQLQFSTRIFRDHNEKYIIMIVDDISAISVPKYS
jgi:nitrogen fixation/metabolism regulation signal transduction histidine kinase